MSEMSAAAKAFDDAFQRDPAAFQALLVCRVPCNQALADDPLIIVETVPTLPDGHFTLGAMGLVNGALSAAGLPLVAARYSEPEDGQPSQLLGFCDYRP